MECSAVRNQASQSYPLALDLHQLELPLQLLVGARELGPHALGLLLLPLEEALEVRLLPVERLLQSPHAR